MRRLTLSILRAGNWVLLPLIMAFAVVVSCRESPSGISDAVRLQPADNGPISVSNSAELLVALSPENAGRRILVRAGAYDVDSPLIVPDGVTLEGEGVMLFEGVGLPVGFAAGTRTTLRMTTNTPGAMLTLGDGVTIRGLEIVDLPGRVGGNVVAVVSRDAGDRISATLIECEIVNPNPAGVAPDGPTGNALFVLTRNLNMGAAPLPHGGALIAARMIRSVIRSPAGGVGLFAFNFAPHGRVSVTLAENVIGGGINANGGVSRPDAVHDAEVRIQSHRNLYRNDSAAPCALPQLGWNLTGGSGPPAPLPVPETVRNTLRVHSIDDRIEGFARAILATGSRRFFAIAGPSSDNSIDMKLLGSRISTPACGGAPFVADFALAGAFAANDALFPGNGNTLHAVVRGVTGSGPRFNGYANARGPSGLLPPEIQGSGNRLEIVGSPNAFARTNHQIDPPPGPEHFTSAQH